MRFSENELSKILAKPDLNFLDYRNYTIANLILFMDLSPFELCTLKVNDLNIYKRKLKEIMLSKEQLKILITYSKLRYNVAYKYSSLINYRISEHLFFTRTGKPLYNNSVFNILRSYNKSLRINPSNASRYFETAKHIKQNYIDDLKYYN